MDDLLDMLELPSRKWPPTKEQLLAHYATREPRGFIQYDGFTCFEADDISQPDENGCTEFCTSTYELMSSPFNVRVLIDSNAKADDVIAHLNNIVGWIKRDGVNRGAFEKPPRRQASEAIRSIHELVAKQYAQYLTILPPVDADDFARTVIEPIRGQLIRLAFNNPDPVSELAGWDRDEKVTERLMGHLKSLVSAWHRPDYNYTPEEMRLAANTLCQTLYAVCNTSIAAREAA